MDKVMFCEYCREEVPSMVKKIDKQSELKGNVYNYKGKAAFCSECNGEIYSAKVNDYNLEMLYKEIDRKVAMDKEERLEYLNNDEEGKQRYRDRERSLHERANMIYITNHYYM